MRSAESLHRFAFEKRKNVEEDQLLPEVSLGADIDIRARNVVAEKWLP